MSKSRLRAYQEDEFSFKKKDAPAAKEASSVPVKQHKVKDNKAQRDEFSFQSSLFKNKKVFAILAVILLLAVAFSTSWYIRTRTLDLPQTEDWAKTNVYDFYKDNVRQQVNKQYPNLPSASKEEIVNNEFDKFYAANKATVDGSVREVRTMIKKNFQDDSGQTYILNIDSFYFLRTARNIVEKGTFYDKLVNGVPIDDHMAAPKGIPADDDLHSRSAAYLFMFVRLFNPDATLPHVAFFVPVLVASLCVIPIFFIVRKKVGNFAGFFAALLFAVHPVFLGRSMGGDFDNDVQNIFFPLIITWLFLEMIETKSYKKKFIFASLMGLFTGIFSFAWKGGWWYIFDFVLGVFGMYIAYMVIKDVARVAVKKNILNVSPTWTRLIIFFGPILFGGILFLLVNVAGIVFFVLYALGILAYFIMMFVRIIKAKVSGKEARYESLLTAVIVLLIYFLATGVFVSLFSSFSLFWSGISSPLRIASIQQAANINYWPNVYTTVAELNTSDFSGVISNISNFGGVTSKLSIFFIIAVMGIILCLVKEKPNWKDYALIIFSIVFYAVITRPQFLTIPKLTYLTLFALPIAIGLFLLLEDETVDIQFAIFLIVWFVATIYAGTKGVRFIHLLVPAFAVAVGITIGKVHRSVSELLRKELNVNKLVVQVCIGVILLLLLISPIRAASSISKGNVPIFDRAWYNAMDAVNRDSKADAIINSWWDFGHFFKYQADRSVTFDGAVQNSPPAHWIGKTLSTDDARMAVGILSMLDCSLHDAFLYLSAGADDTIKTIDTLNEIIVLPMDEADALLEKKGFGEEFRKGLLEKTHCAPPEDYFVTSGDMVGKAGVWAHFGNWDFKKAYIYNNIRGMSRENAVSFLKEKLGLSDEQAENFYMQVISLTTDREANSWISPWPGYVTSNAVPCERVNKTVVCRANLGISQNAQTTTVIEKVIVNLEDMENSSLVITVFDKTMTQRLAQSFERPRDFVITGEDDFITVPFPNATFPYDVVVDTYKLRMIIADPLLSKSTFTKLFYFDGIYMPHFDKLFEERSQTQGNVIVWKVDWDGKTGSDLEKAKAGWGIVPAEKPKVEEPVEEINVTYIGNRTEEIINASDG